MKEAVKIFLESGLLESYLLGETTMEESNKVERYVRDFPEVKKAYNSLEATIEQWAGMQAKSPPADLKNNILKEINKLDETPIKSIKPSSESNWRLMAATVAAILFSVLSFLFWNEKEKLHTANELLVEELNAVEKESLVEREQCAVLEKQFHLLNDPNTGKYILNGNEKAAEFQAIAFWNKETQQSYLNIISFPELPEKKCLQMWADVDGEMINVGILKKEENKLVAIPFKINATSLNITIEPDGGSEHPTVTDLISIVVI